MRKTEKALCVLLCIGLLCALALCGIRIRYERQDVCVCAAMSEAELGILAEHAGLPDARAAAERLGVRIMEREALRLPGILVEDGNQYSYDPAFGAYVPDGANVRAFLVEGTYAERYGTLGYSDAQPIEDMLFRAVTDRNIRLLYLRLFRTADGDCITDLSAYEDTLRGLSRRIAAHGLRLGDEPSAIAPYAPSPILRYLTAVSVICGALWLLCILFPKRSGWWIWALLLLGAVFTAALLRFLPRLFTLGFSFAAAVTSSCLAMAAMLPLVRETEGKRPVLRFCEALLIGFAVALGGGAVIAALQSGSEWMLAVENFRGVKLSMLLPLGFAAILALRDLCRPRELLKGRRVVTAAVILLALGCAALLLLRTGNAAGAVSVFEQRVRAWLENVLIVRPRTKEFCFGWPCLALCCAAMHRKRRLAVPCFVFTSVAVSSAVNTFCHSRSPIWLSAVRGALGAVFGLGIGLALLGVLRLVCGKGKRTGNSGT